MNRRGFGRFTRNAVGRLVELDPATTYVLLLDEASAGADELPSAAEQLVVELGRPASEAASADSRRSLRDLARLARAARGAELDAFLFPSMLTYFPVLRVPTVVGLHDTIAQDLPELTFPRRRSRYLWALKQRVATRTAAHVFTVSEASRDAVARRVGLAPERLTIVPEAPDPVFHPRSRPELERVLSAIGLDGSRDFVLYAGGISPHKNIETLLDAFAGLRGRRERPLLVLVGDLERETYVSAAASIRRRIEELGLGSHVLLPGFVSDDALAALYTAATAVALPSLAEGFGLPAVEAAACGAAVVLSDLPAHRESLGNDGGLYFAPQDSAALTAALELLLEDVDARAALAARGRAAVAELTWDAAAERLRGLLHKAARA
jgi:glycosyltransferase involved in cell wall biosynthesis